MATYLSPGTSAQLLVLGIPAEKHNVDDLRRMIPPFDGIAQAGDIEALAEIVIYLGQRRILSVKTNSWSSLPWGTHSCLFYKSNTELTEPMRNFFREGLAGNEKCVWIVSKSYGMEKARKLTQKLLEETGLGDTAFELIRHEDWYESPSGRFRDTDAIFTGWIGKIDAALKDNFAGLRVSGDAHCHPDDLKPFFDYEGIVNNSVSSLKIKALCTYYIPKFAARQIHQILDTHQQVFGDFAVSGA